MHPTTVSSGRMLTLELECSSRKYCSPMGGVMRKCTLLLGSCFRGAKGEDERHSDLDTAKLTGKMAEKHYT